MAITVRRADLGRDRELLIGFFLSYLTPHSDGRRYDWLYRRNPQGSASAWIAEDASVGALVGAAAAFPRRLCDGGVTKSGYVLGDFCIHPGYRSMGPALQLQRACLEGIGGESAALGYDFPSHHMLAVYRRLGIEPSDRLVRLAKPLRTIRKIAGTVRVQLIARGLGAIGDPLLAWRDRRLERAKGWAITSQQRAGEEFTGLAQDVSAAHGVCVERSAEYLNWRFFEHPLHKHEMLTARRDGVLRGYVVFMQRGEDAEIIDLFGVEDRAMWRALVGTALRPLRERGVVTLSASILASHPRAKMLQSFGFRVREACPVVTRMPVALASPGRRWFLMDGDRDS
jgi:hypothetical protein